MVLNFLKLEQTNLILVLGSKADILLVFGRYKFSIEIDNPWYYLKSPPCRYWYKVSICIRSHQSSQFFDMKAIYIQRFQPGTSPTLDPKWMEMGQEGKFGPNTRLRGHLGANNCTFEWSIWIQLSLQSSDGKIPLCAHIYYVCQESTYIVGCRGGATTTSLVSIGLFHPSPVCYKILSHVCGDHGGIPIMVKWRVFDNWELLQGEELIVMLLALSTLCTSQICMHCLFTAIGLWPIEVLDIGTVVQIDA